MIHLYTHTSIYAFFNYIKHLRIVIKFVSTIHVIYQVDLESIEVTCFGINQK